jgi:hypothetical protein
MAKGGTYAQLFQKQAYFYRSGDGSGGGPSAGVSGFAPEP